MGQVLKSNLSTIIVIIIIITLYNDNTLQLHLIETSRLQSTYNELLRQQLFEYSHKRFWFL